MKGEHICTVKVGHNLVPVYKSDVEKINKLPKNTVFDTRVFVPRNLLLHKKYFALVRFFFHQVDPEVHGIRLFSEEHARKVLMVAINEYNEYPGIDGEVIIDFPSISFENMDETEFQERIYHPTVKFISHYLNVPEEDIDSNKVFEEYM
jgi:hypothetical protein